MTTTTIPRSRLERFAWGRTYEGKHRGHRRPSRLRAWTLAAVLTFAVSFSLGVITAALTPAQAASAAASHSCATRYAHSVTRYPARGEIREEARITRTCGHQRQEWAQWRAAWTSGETAGGWKRDTANREEGRWVIVREHAQRVTTYPGGYTVTVTTDVHNCARWVTVHRAYPDGRTRDSRTVEATC